LITLCAGLVVDQFGYIWYQFHKAFTFVTHS
jgi:hypothetical protein